MRALDSAGKVIETHEHAGEFKGFSACPVKQLAIEIASSQGR
jgi:hypothetical protein